jgi:hypothetical protein
MPHAKQAGRRSGPDDRQDTRAEALTGEPALAAAIIVIEILTGWMHAAAACGNASRLSRRAQAIRRRSRPDWAAIKPR